MKKQEINARQSLAVASDRSQGPSPVAARGDGGRHGVPSLPWGKRHGAASKSPVIVTATWDGARHWLNAAGMFEQGKLFSQVMVGFELAALQKTHGIVNGSKAHLSQDGKGDDWETILKKETGLSQSTAYRFMSMAKAAAPRLKKFPALKNFDLFAKPLSLMPAPQREAMENAVKKITDGKTQAEFGEQLGLWKKPHGSGATGRAPGEGGEKKKFSIAEMAAAHQEMAAVQWFALEKMLGSYRDKFLVLTDHAVEAQMAALEQALNARKAWLKQPQNKREPKVIAELF